MGTAQKTQKDAAESAKGKPAFTSRREIRDIIVHCSATPAGRDVGAAEIRGWHVRDRGFSDIGYHFVVRLDGSIERGRALDVAGAHCRGHNACSVGVCYIGGLDTGGAASDTRTPAQRKALRRLIGDLKRSFPGVTVYGHRDFAPKECPCFDARSEYADD